MSNSSLLGPVQDHTPEGRFAAIRAFIRAAQHSMLNASVLLARAHETEELRDLGFPSFTAYAAELEIPQSAASKMVRVGRTFSENGEPVWWSLPAHDQAELSIERLYLAARRVELEQCSAEEALYDAVAHPPRWHRALLRGDEPLDEKPCVCPACGTTHWTKA